MIMRPHLTFHGILFTLIFLFDEWTKQHPVFEGLPADFDTKLKAIGYK